MLEHEEIADVDRIGWLKVTASRRRIWDLILRKCKAVEFSAGNYMITFEITLQLHCVENGWQGRKSGHRKAIQEDFALFQVRGGDVLDHNDSMGVGGGEITDLITGCGD